MQNLEIGHVTKFHQKISPFEKFVARYVLLNFIKRQRSIKDTLKNRKCLWQGVKNSSFVVLIADSDNVNLLGMDHVVTIENEENHKKDKNLTLKLNSLDVIQNRYSHYNYDNKLTAHKPYDLFRDNSSKSNDNVSINSFPKEVQCASGLSHDLRQTSHPSSKSFLEIIHGTIYTNNNASDMLISSNSGEEHRGINGLELPTYRSLSFCIMKDQPPAYYEVTGIKPRVDEVSKKYF